MSQVHCYHPADIDSLGIVVDTLWELSHLWFHLGLVFGLTYSRLKAIQRNCLTAGHRIVEVVSSWLSLRDQVLQQGQPSWRTLVRALAHPLVGDFRLAEELAETHKVCSYSHCINTVSSKSH